MIAKCRGVRVGRALTGHCTFMDVLGLVHIYGDNAKIKKWDMGGVCMGPVHSQIIYHSNINHRANGPVSLPQSHRATGPVYDLDVGVHRHL